MPATDLLKQKDKKFRLLFRDYPLPMLVLDQQTGQILEANAAATALYGYAADEFRGTSLSDLNAADLGAVEPVTASPSPDTIWSHRRKNGGMVEVEAAVHEVELGGQRVNLAILMDITPRRQLEEQLRQARKMEAVGMLAGGVAHDFNNLLTIITGYSQLILNNLRPADPNRHSVEQIMKAGERAAALTKQLLAFSRRQALQPKVLDLNKLVGNSSTMLRRLIGEDIDLRLVLPPDLGRVSADSGQMEQVLMNLVINARDAMPKGGTLTIETGNVRLDKPYTGRHITLKPGAYIRLSVSDNGSGMDEATQSRLFEPFFTTKVSGKGTGLGLSTVFAIVQQSGGSVDVYSQPGRGTAVKVYLPRIDQPVSLETDGVTREAPRGSETILLVEDDEMVRTLVRETLERHGYKILEAPGPLEARRISDQYRPTIQLLITDVVMPKVSGRELAEQLTQRRPGMRVLYMSGYTDNAVLNSVILRDEVAFLQKPFTPAALTAKVREVLEGGDRMQKAAK